MDKIKILVPLDFSDLSIKALEVANKVAGLFNGTITPFHAYIPVTDMDGFNILGGAIGTDENLKSVEKVIRQRLNELIENKIDTGVANDPVVEIGNPARAISEAAKDYDMIVMSTHGRTGFMRFIMGSVAEKVLRTSPIPVLMVEEFSKTFPLKTILLTTDFSKNSQKAFPYAASIAEKTGAKITLLHVLSKDTLQDIQEIDAMIEDRKNALKEWIDVHLTHVKDLVKPEVIVTTKSVSEAIHDLNFSRQFNLIVMATIGRSGLKNMVLGSVASSVVRNNETAVLTVNPAILSD